MLEVFVVCINFHKKSVSFHSSVIHLSGCFIILDLLGLCVLKLSDLSPRFSWAGLLPLYGCHLGYYCTCFIVLLPHLASTLHALSKINFPLHFPPFPVNLAEWSQFLPEVTGKYLSCPLRSLHPE